MDEWKLHILFPYFANFKYSNFLFFPVILLFIMQLVAIFDPAMK